MYQVKIIILNRVNLLLKTLIKTSKMIIIISIHLFKVIDHNCKHK